MADPLTIVSTVSAIVTLATTSLDIIRGTIRFIRDAQEIDAWVQKLLDTLVFTESMLQIISSTCEQAGPMEGDRYVEATLRICRTRLVGVEKMVHDIASEKRKNFLHRAILIRKIRSDNSRKLIEGHIRDIQNMKQEIIYAFNCWNIQIACTIRDHISGAPPRQQPAEDTSARLEYGAEDESIGPSIRSFSAADTVVCERSSSSRRPSTSTRTSISSSRPLQIRRSQSGRPDETASILSSDQSADLEKDDFHRDLNDYFNSKGGIQVILERLQQDPGKTELANSVNRFGRTPLHLAAQKGDVELGRVLLEFSANIDATDSRLRSVLDVAIECNKASNAFVRFLLENSVDQSAVAKCREKVLEDIKNELEYERERMLEQASKPKKASKSEKSSKK